VEDTLPWLVLLSVTPGWMGGGNFFMMMAMQPWPTLPSEVVDAPSLEPFQARFDGALSTLTWLKMSLPVAGGWTGWPRKVPSHPNRSV